ncbi:glycosyltransferase family 2 protein [Cellulomonas denverensis]|uniref:Glycosyltransferase family 2 protein n=1 Tax=Cellulomonas denverensis TaxID=264297 RepID=A0A7X6QXM8_9CELL|nr:glycosyltransferase family A protein [Cellulomonas denverensis]NKY21235.1 glycosyltransferase family 2 protein [Cellulomonas denverensis]GIG24527.1 hypothetical protein Cde04nite_07710 [Cellulomonas denverensis]
MDHDPIDLSVIIAARNAATTLPAQLDALAAQRGDGRWELIVADNGSTDATADLVRLRSADWPELHLVDAAGRPGAGHARNLGALTARGRWLAFCDADDVVADDWVAAITAALAHTPLVAGRLDWERLNSPDLRRSRALPQVDGLQSTDPLPGLGHAAASNLGVHAALFHALGGFDLGARFLQDTDLCWRAQLSGTPLVFAPDAVVHMRLRRGLRGAWRQGRNTGMGERWLAARYGALSTAPSSSPPTPRPSAADPAPDSALDAGPAPADAPDRRSLGPRRVLRRAGLVAAQLARVRHHGDLAGLCWDLGFGVGFARGGLPDPEPYSAPEHHALRA